MWGVRRTCHVRRSAAGAGGTHRRWAPIRMGTRQLGLFQQPVGAGHMFYAVLADATLVLHLCFILFVVFGGLLVLRWPRVAWMHLPAAVWGVLVEVSGWICPLTPLEIALRRGAGSAAYDTSFVEHYLAPAIYPSTLTREAQIILGVIVLSINVAVYGVVWRRSARTKR